MTVDVVNNENKKVGSLDLSDEVFGGRVKIDLIHESVVRENAAKRRGTHATKTRGLVSGSGKKPWRQKGTGRARVGENRNPLWRRARGKKPWGQKGPVRARVGKIRNPLWRKGGTTFGPQPRSYEYQLPKKVEKGALRAALSAKLQEGALVLVDELTASEIKTKAAAGLLKSLGVDGKALLVDAALDEKFALSVRNLPGLTLRL